MLKPDLERHCRAMREAVNEALRRARPHTALHCLFCAAGHGEQHKKTCAFWPLIEARAAYAMDADADTETETLL